MTQRERFAGSPEPATAGLSLVVALVQRASAVATALAATAAAILRSNSINFANHSACSFASCHIPEPPGVNNPEANPSENFRKFSEGTSFFPLKKLDPFTAPASIFVRLLTPLVAVRSRQTKSKEWFF
jgi:hypothetical protein